MKKTELSLAESTKIKTEKLVIKDNALVMASYTLSVEEQRLVLACIEKAQRNKKGIVDNAIRVSLNAMEYSDIYNISMKSAYKGLQKASDKLYERSINIIEEDGVLRKRRWLQEQAIYDSGRVDLVFSASISEHISDIVNKAGWRLEQATQLRSQHAIRLFEILHQTIDSKTLEGEWEATVEEIKWLLELQNEYEDWRNFKRRIIVEPVSQINKNTSLKVEWAVAGKEGRKITKLRFKVFESEQLSLSF